MRDLGWDLDFSSAAMSDGFLRSGTGSRVASIPGMCLLCHLGVVLLAMDRPQLALLESSLVDLSWRSIYHHTSTLPLLAMLPLWFLARNWLREGRWDLAHHSTLAAAHFLMLVIQCQLAWLPVQWGDHLAGSRCFLTVSVIFTIMSCQAIPDTCALRSKSPPSSPSPPLQLLQPSLSLTLVGIGISLLPHLMGHVELCLATIYLKLASVVLAYIHKFLSKQEFACFGDDRGERPKLQAHTADDRVRAHSQVRFALEIGTSLGIISYVIYGIPECPAETLTHEIADICDIIRCHCS